MAQVSNRSRISGWASSNRHRTPSHLSFAASSRALLYPYCQSGKQGGEVVNQNLNLPGPIEVIVLANKTVTGVVDDQEMIRTGILEERGHLVT